MTWCPKFSGLVQNKDLPLKPRIVFHSPEFFKNETVKFSLFYGCFYEVPEIFVSKGCRFHETLGFIMSDCQIWDRFSQFQDSSPTRQFTDTDFGHNWRQFTNGERGGSVVEYRTPEREVGGSKPTAAVLCPWARHFTPRKYWLITQEAMAPSQHDWKIVDWDVKPQHNTNSPTLLKTVHQHFCCRTCFCRSSVHPSVNSLGRVQH